MLYRFHTETGSLGLRITLCFIHRALEQGLRWGKEGPCDSKAFRLFNVWGAGEEVNGEVSPGNSAGLAAL